jgi:hypothetical protein
MNRIRSWFPFAVHLSGFALALAPCSMATGRASSALFASLLHLASHCTQRASVSTPITQTKTRKACHADSTLIVPSLASVGLACSQPGQSTRAVIFNGLSGLGFGSPLVLIIAGVQLSTPHQLIATSTAVVTSARAIAASSFTAIYGAALNKSIAAKLPSYIAEAAESAGLPSSSIQAFVGAMASKAPNVASIPGVTPDIIAAGAAAAERALADSFRIIYIIAVPFGVVAVILCFLLPNLSATMHYKIDAPMELFHARQKDSRHQA